MKNFFANAFATLYFVVIMLPLLLILLFVPLGLSMDMSSITSSGFAGKNTGISFVGVFGLFFGISMLVPALRRMYKKLPWLYSCIQVFMIDILVMTAGIYILNIGYEVQNPARHILFIWLMVACLVIGRLAMCFYYKWKPAKFVKE